jgi:hypothetical protein
VLWFGREDDRLLPVDDGDDSEGEGELLADATAAAIMLTPAADEW